MYYQTALIFIHVHLFEMDSIMAFKAVVLIELSATKLTFVRFLSSMYSHVTTEEPFRPENFSAIKACPRPLALPLNKQVIWK